MDVTLPFETWSPYALSLLIGFMVGFQRERTDPTIAGIRTFPLLTLFGTICGTFADRFTPWLVVGGLIAVVGLIVVGSPRPRDPEHSSVTTEAAMLVMYALGVVIPFCDAWLAIILAAVVALLLHFKPALHGLVARIGERDLNAIVQFVIVSCIVLPLVPVTEWGPGGVINLHETWWMVVLMVGIGLSAYVLYKWFGSEAGVLLSGVLGGAISSTATTATYAKRSKGSAGTALLAAVIVLFAAATAYTRQLIEIAVVAPHFMAAAALRLGPVGGTILLAALVGFVRVRKEKPKLPEPENPAELKVALLFAALYSVVHVAAALAKTYGGATGLYVIAGLSGLTDIDAITLATSRQVSSGGLDPDTGASALLLASLTNTAFKLGMVGVLGSRRMLLFVGIGFCAALAVGAVVFFFMR